MADPITAAKIALVLSDKKNLKVIFFGLLFLLLLVLLIIALPFLIICAVLLTLNPFGQAELDNDIYFQSIQDVKAEYRIENELPTSVVKTIDFTLNGDLMDSKREITAFIKDYFVDSKVVAEKKDVPSDDPMSGESKTVTVKKTVYFFISAEEISSMLRTTPFEFSEDDIEFIQLLYDEGEEDTEDVPVIGDDGSLTGGVISLVKGGAHYTQGWHGMGRGAGVDIGATIGTPVVAAFDGSVDYYIWRNNSGAIVSYGAVAFLRSDNGKTAIYAHLSRFDTFESGAYIAAFPSIKQFAPNVEQYYQSKQVKQGDVIGAVGNTGYSFGPHLHFGLMIDGKAVNPMKYFR
ncbi:murein DD-endopeptidase MepM/ murein hydrolase activator NlpD [Hydrogenoanaerobacterium saccharovorans]|uniref:Murein DD-endopeptidase MepM and murein hydrolase activator NlpD, contain LysM domain n=1 Tax=Hydrogenoanaerobacterium saccharovorans TaxID=474960 RepID=A0A1H8AW75_9FIRM|nr:M23 family metallopeptidase [Hydrogenoanaerobacterium saccharovorans]RPF47708.1 murein DD-endopeptidase MepM/ murein hydrolase activator NlpD [Hydrogenoanaerobacterium saccharovorans]SEM75071.1 Murein DD-endopeptidase MepM and murein hydrolase activator NlpD, contain LysM domain [Hydrogenoanaerobacterium saccharovorans]